MIFPSAKKVEGMEGAGQGINDGLCRLKPTFSKTGTKVNLVYSFSDTNKYTVFWEIVLSLCELFFFFFNLTSSFQAIDSWPDMDERKAHAHPFL